MRRTLRIGMLSAALAALLMPLASAHVGAGADARQVFLVCSLGGDVDTNDVPLFPDNARVFVKRDCSLAHAEYEAENVRLRCASIDFLALLPPLQAVFDELETRPDNPPPWGPGAPAPHGCWLQAGVTLP